MNYPAYPIYKYSEVEWLGKIPVHWKEAQLRYITLLKYGDSLAADIRDESGVVPVYGSNGIVGYHSESNTLAPAIIVGRKGSYGKVTFSELEGYCIDTTYFIDYSCCKQNLRWLFYALQPAGLDMFSQDTGVPGLSREKAYSTKFVQPPFDEQLAIADFLDQETAKIDTLIAKQQQLIEITQEKRQALISHVITKGLDPDAQMTDSGVAWLGKVPSHWQVKRLKHIADVHTGVAKGRDLSGQDTIEVPYLRVANVQDGYIDLSDVATITIARTELERYSLKTGDVLMNEGGDNDKLGRGHVWYGQIDPCIHQNHVFAVRPKKVEPEWLTLVTSAEYAKFYFFSFAKQSTNLASISSSNLRELPIVCPPAEERHQIREYLKNETKRIDKLVDKAKQTVGLLQERRTSLISAAVTGKIDVRTYGNHEP